MDRWDRRLAFRSMEAIRVRHFGVWAPTADRVRPSATECDAFQSLAAYLLTIQMFHHLRVTVFPWQVRFLFHGTSVEAIDSIIHADTAGFLPLLSVRACAHVFVHQYFDIPHMKCILPATRLHFECVDGPHLKLGRKGLSPGQGRGFDPSCRL